MMPSVSRERKREATPIPPPLPPLPRPSFLDAARRMVIPALLAASFVVPPPSTHSGPLLGLPSLCLFYRLTGWPCPGCGLSRSCVCFAHGRWAESLAFHPLGPPTFLVMACLVAFRLPFFRRITPNGDGRFGRWSAGAAYAATGLFLLVWLARLLHFLPPPPLL